MATVKRVTVRDIAVWNKEKFEEGLGFARTMFGISSMHEEQLEALRHFFRGKHLYFSAPTGYGKSLIYQVIPFVNDYLMDQLTLPSCILVVTPLQSLMLDQVSKLRALGINTAAIYADQSEEVLLEIENGGVYNIIFTSPESMLATCRWRRFLSSTAFKDYCVCVAFDEAHCIAQCKYVSNDTKFEVLFSELLDELAEKGVETIRTIIFCQTRNQCALIWRTFQLKLGEMLYADSSSNLRSRLVEMFHAGTPSSVKEHVLKEVGAEKSYLRILVVTTAFGMGIDCKQVHRVVHFGPAKSIEAYIQECGRAGRDGQISFCYLLYNGFLTSHCQSDMKEYVTSDKCRRKNIESIFPGSHPIATTLGCLCCDVCLLKCSCTIPCSAQILHFSKKEVVPVPTRVRLVTQQQKDDLLMRLLSLKNVFKQEFTTYQEKSTPKVMMEFTDFHINQIMQCCHHLFNLDDVLSKIEIWRMKHASLIFQLLNGTFGDMEVPDDLNPDATSFDHLEDEIEDHWLDIRDDSDIMSFGDVDVGEIDRAIESIDQSGTQDHSLGSIIDYHGVKPFIHDENDEPME
ncbi:uncharacterized protein LOC135689329, partial [Rhopilema esculentum]|uniref:uncharacterized protein LOC135689329 n=1 Tax=Rhopilema esculentum TaxID=499914 RepID=UPI0031E41FFD